MEGVLDLIPMVLQPLQEELLLALEAPGLGTPVQYAVELTAVLAQLGESTEVLSAEVQADWAWMEALAQVGPPTESQKAACPRAASRVWAQARETAFP